jgi:hypothetical protein
MGKIFYIILINFLFLSFLEGQAMQDSLEKPALPDYLDTGQFSGHYRQYFMATVNSGDLKDYYALTGGLGMGYRSKVWKGFQLEISQFYIFNIFSNDLSVPDPKSGIASRYELGNYDVERPEKRNNLFRSERLNVSYLLNKTKFIFGRQMLISPFINPQDGRMRPTMQEGILVTSKELNHFTFQSGWFYKISPRSSMEWHNAGYSIGVYAAGVDILGNPSAYKHQIKSKGVLVNSIQYSPLKYVNISIWNYYLENVLQTTFGQAELSLPISKNDNYSLVFGVQSVYQSSLGNGGNEDPLKSYIPAGSKSFVWSTRTGIEHARWKLSINYTRIVKGDRFLMPREWGVDPFYTFIPRERIEGNADTRAMAVKSEWNPQSNTSAGMMAGWVKMPEVLDYRQNKYQMPSYIHLAFFVKYSFKKEWEGLQIHLLYVYKKSVDPDSFEPRFVMNKVDMSNINGIVNYTF